MSFTSGGGLWVFAALCGILRSGRAMCHITMASLTTSPGCFCVLHQLAWWYYDSGLILAATTLHLPGGSCPWKPFKGDTWFGLVAHLSSSVVKIALTNKTLSRGHLAAKSACLKHSKHCQLHNTCICTLDKCAVYFYTSYAFYFSL